MIKRIEFVILLPLLVVCCWSSVIAQAETKDLRNRYQYIEISRFEVKAGIAFPDEYMEQVMKGVIKSLRGTGKFKSVFAEGEAHRSADNETILLVGIVTKYKEGNRGKRFIALGLAGDRKIVAHVKFLDKATGKLLLEADVDGIVRDGVLGGSAKSAPSGIGKDVAKIAGKVFF